MSEAKLKILISRREYLYRSMQILYDISLELVHDRSKIPSFRSRFSRIENVKSEFYEIDKEISTIELALKPDSQISTAKLEAFDQLYYEVLQVDNSLQPTTKNLTLQSPPGGEPSGTAFVGASHSDQIHARLPKIDLPKFDSNIENWQTFYDTFVTLIHENNSISTIEKFHYLISCLSGSALAIAKGVPLTSDNYQTVFDALLERYHNKRILAVTYLEKICNYPPIKANNYNELQYFTNVLYESFNALNTLNIEHLSEFILFHLASRALDADTRKRFEIQNQNKIPVLQDLIEFLQNYVKVLESSNLSHLNPPRTANANLPQTRSHSYQNSTPQNRSQSYQNNKNNYPRKQNTFNPNQQRSFVTSQAVNSNSKAINCLLCNLEHNIYKCPTFLSYNLSRRIEFVKNKNLCLNCLRSNHSITNCFSKMSCQTCGSRHHTLLHSSETTPASQSPPRNEGAGAGGSQNNTSAHVGHSRENSVVLLGTATVCVYDAFGSKQYLRALIDSASQDCFMTSASVKKLGLPFRRCNLTVAGLGENKVQQVQGTTQCTIQPRECDEPTFHISPIILDSITSKMPTAIIPNSVREQFKHLVLADCDFDKLSNIDLLLGAELFHKIYDGQRLQPRPNLPAALHSVFGWVITGAVDVSSCTPPNVISSLIASTHTLDEVVKQFWEVEEPPRARIVNPDDLECERIYNTRMYREDNGRYVVPLLLKEPHGVLGDSFNKSLSRLFNIERKLNRDAQLSAEYSNFMTEYHDLGHMNLVNTSQQNSKYIIPHHCVIRPESDTTKLRVVFDASSKSSNGLSLNDLVYPGPKLQADVIDIITNFRLHAIVFTCDISKMYRQINILPEERVYQHILWRESPSEQVDVYELQTVTYGVSSSPYLAIRTLHQLARDHGAQCPRATDLLLNRTFMDDINGGAASVEEALELKNELIQLLSFGQFQLRKWSSNSLIFLENLPSDHCQKPKVFSTENNKLMLKILGVQWDPNGDYFTYNVSQIESNCTKRCILSNVARIFDPVGWLAPFILLAKLILQNLWRQQLSWDEIVPESIEKDWKDFTSELSNLNSINIPRLIIPLDTVQTQLIGFCDGSTKAYGCCIYIRTVTCNGQIHVSLLIAKSKVAPLKPLTVNRIELCGAVLLARLMSHMQTLLSRQLNINQILSFTDSSTVLSWLNTAPHNLKTFVAHRVVQITESLPPSQWRHVSTQDNPADLCSRGLTCSQLAACETWWTGPQWLRQGVSEWPDSVPQPPSEPLPELKLISSSHVAQEVDINNLIPALAKRTSSLTKLQRILAWCFRFIFNIKQPQNKRKQGFLTSEDLENSLYYLVRYEQLIHFECDISNLKHNKPLPKHLQKLSPFLDSTGLLRVGGRLQNADLPNEVKHPLLLPKTSFLSKLIIDNFHIKYLHCGPRTLHSLIQRRFWILGSRNLIRSRLSKCITCFKFNPSKSQPLMGDLPKSRLTEGQCFRTCGIDFGGPFFVKESRRRNAKGYKVYICLFVCFSVKAVHLEIVTELSTEAFIAALDRFVARRGLCEQIVTDCGTNFVGAKRYLCEVRKMLSEEHLNISDKLASRNINWKLNPPSAPHFGGIFESGIKSTKYLLKRVVGSQLLTLEEFYTILTKVEAMLNSRPLCAISSDPNEVDVLTAGHFLIGRPLVAVPEPPLNDEMHPRSRWQLLQRLSQSFWRRWQRDYLHTLQQRTKWSQNKGRHISVGDIVTIMEPNLAPNEWRLGRVIQVHPGQDQTVRVVTVKTNRGTLVRPVVKLCPLPIEN